MSVTGCNEDAMPILYVVGALVSSALLIYLVVALLMPERFS